MLDRPALPEETGARDLKRVRYVTANYPNLLGLAIMPGALIFLTLAVADAVGLGGWQGLLAFLCSAVLAVGLYKAITVFYYERRFGFVRSEKFGMDDMSPRELLVVACAALFALLLPEVLPQVNKASLLLGLQLVVIFWEGRTYARHWLLLGCSLIVLSFLPIVFVDRAVASLESGQSWNPPILVIAGLIFAVGSLLDHRLLVRTWHPIPEEKDDEHV